MKLFSGNLRCLLVLAAFLILPAAAFSAEPGVLDQVNTAIGGAVTGGANALSGAGNNAYQNGATTGATTGSTTGSSGNAGGNGTDPGVAALEKTCGVSAVAQNGQLKIFSVGVKCFENIVNGLAQSTIMTISNSLHDIVYTLLVLWLIIYGARVSLGMTQGEQAKKEFMIHALKIAFVAWLVFSLGLLDIYNLVLGSYYSLIGIVLAGANLGDCSTAGAITSGGTDAIWSTMDCMLSKFVGWQSKNGFGTQYKNVPYFFGIIFMKMLPSNGFLVGGILFSAMWSLLTGFFRMAFVYILSIMALILLFAISPLMVPMILFKRTYAFFDGWVKLIVSMILQPVILFAFFSFTASMLSKTITDLQALFAQVKLANETSHMDVTGDQITTHQTIGMIGDTLGKLDPQILLSGITTLIIAYLLISFISFVSRMATELAGTSQAPELGLMSTNIFGGDFR